VNLQNSALRGQAKSRKSNSNSKRWVTLREPKRTIGIESVNDCESFFKRAALPQVKSRQDALLRLFCKTDSRQ
jgi:hypothetical protein